MVQINIKNVSKYFGDVRGVDNASITIQEGEFFTLLGPSGCGKTTLLRTLAGFYQQEEGDIFFGDKCINNLPAYKRNIGMVFQSYAIFPHMSVFENVAYGLKARKIQKKEIERRVMEALEMVELSHLKDRQPSQMSGGQQQRIALARAIVIHPGLLLMDEPLSNLDAKLRLKMRSDIRDLQKRLNITTIYVTHDQEEALAVSDRIAVLNNGKIQQIGKPYEVYLRPMNKFVANFIGSTNFIHGTIQGIDENQFANVIIENTKFNIKVTKNFGGNIIYSIRPEQVKIKRNNTQFKGPFIKGRIIDSLFLGEKVEYKILLLNTGKHLQVHEYSVAYDQLMKVSDEVEVYLNPEEAVLFDQSGEEVLNIYGSNTSNSSFETV
ncbi:ABC transporter ATP-binding protein [Heyndrickxia oleronia]|uniref:ABC transporter ATP-binding protein n=1 Tax=Heyndrickxia oleronia TaxID=38875 RepID=UPI001B205981|nr:ABC transporter ATP-binding protein [Heyndrickxia oleronia]GIN39879.1 Fe(3+) ions import ATP-binding protein FbpC [Heyndrickxia oleronia]